MTPNPVSRQEGFTLIELLVAMAIGAMLMSALGATVSAISRSQTLIRDYENIQETLRFTTILMTRSLRSAQKVKSLTGTEVAVELNGSAPSCLGTYQNGDTWAERYFLQGGNLRCEVDGNDSEVIAFGVESMQLDCVDYEESKNGVSEFGNMNCEGATADQVIALRIRLTLNAAEMNQINTSFEHYFTVALKNRLDSLRK